MPDLPSGSWGACRETWGALGWDIGFLLSVPVVLGARALLFPWPGLAGMSGLLPMKRWGHVTPSSPCPQAEEAGGKLSPWLGSSGDGYCCGLGPRAFAFILGALSGHGALPSVGTLASPGP